MVVAVDFDGCIDSEQMQRLIKKLNKERNEVWIVTARRGNNFDKDKLKTVLMAVGLTEYHVIYCNGKPKYDMLQMLNADIYIDNISDEFESLFNHTNVIPLLFTNKF